MNFINLLQEEILTEEDQNAIPQNFQKILSKLVYKEPFVARLFGRSHTDWIKTTAIKTMGVTPKMGRIKFYYNPTWMNQRTDAELNFLLQHEIYHIFRSHGSRGAGVGATTKRLHELHNIAADALINGDCIKDGGFGGLPSKAPEGGWFLDDSQGNDYSSVNAVWGKDGQVKYNTKGEPISMKDGKDVYTGTMNSENIYKWMLERDKDAQKKIPPQEQQEGEGEGGGDEQPKWEPSIGDVVFNKKTGKYGKVTGRHGKNVKVEEITEEEAKASLESKSFKTLASTKINRKEKLKKSGLLA